VMVRVSWLAVELQATAPVFSIIGYTASTSACVTSYIVGIANSVTVTDASGNLRVPRRASE
jgi:hypothetical protein